MKIYLFDVASNAGCLDEGTEQSPAHFRSAGLTEELQRSGLEVVDLGGVPLPNLERHNRPPVRNYPSPKIVWERTREFLRNPKPIEDGDIFLCLGGDCSIIVGTAAAMADRYGTESIHVLYVDGDTDSISPNPEKCVGSAGMGLYFLTEASEYWNACQIPANQITVIGNKEDAPGTAVSTISLQRLHIEGILPMMSSVLKSIPKDRRLFVHFDVDVLSEKEMPASYAPRAAGLTFSDIELILKLIVADHRTIFLEITEFVPSKDPMGNHAKSLVDVIVQALHNRKEHL